MASTPKDFMQAALEELRLTAAVAEPHYSKLRTADISEDRKKSQFRRIAKFSSPEKLYLHNDCFIVRFKCEEQYYLALKTEDLTDSELRETYDFLSTFGLSEHELEECFFLYLRHELKRLYKVKKERRDPKASKDILDLSSDDSYTGHDIYDLMEYHDRIDIFKIDQDSIFSTCEMWGIAASIAASLAPYRSALIPHESAQQIIAISSVAPHLSENTYTALTSLHWKYTFFELYKCIEALFFLPWGLLTKTGFKLQSSAFDSHQSVMRIISFKTKEVDSIEKLFNLLDDKFVPQAKSSNINSFKDLTLNEDIETISNSKQLIGRRIYKIRNTLVHQEDFEDKSPINLDKENWSSLINYLCTVITYLYSNFNAELPTHTA